MGRATEFETTRDLLDEVPNATRDRIYASTRPTHPRRVTPVATCELRELIASLRNGSRRGSRPRLSVSAAR
jgi:hypothetical protein